MNSILLKDALTQMERRDERGRPVPFSLEFVTCNVAKDTGGERVQLEHWVLAKHAQPNAPAGPTPGVRRPTPPRPASEHQAQTRNFFNPLNGEIRTAAIRLILYFNGLEVLP